MSGGRPVDAPPFSVVLADDDPDIRLLVKMVLEEGGRFRVVAEAGHGDEAVDLVRRHRPDLTLLDVSMPEMDGLEALPLIREASPETKVVVLSGFAREHVEVAALAGGALGYLEKGGSFLALVDELLALGGLLEVVGRAVEEVTAHLDADPRSAGQARRLVDETLRRWSCGELLDVVNLLVSEVVTNAVVHGRSQVVVTVQLRPAAVRIDVLDNGTGLPVPRVARADATSGRGMALVEALASSWGIDARDGGKSVWFEVPRPDAGGVGAGGGTGPR